MALKIKKATTALLEGDTHIKIMVWGDSGAGKTHFGATAKKPLVVQNEAQGATSVAFANKDADILPVTTADELREFMMEASKGKDGALAEYETIVFDSLTECQRLFKKEILQGQIDRKTGKARTQLTQQEWGILAEKTLGFIGSLRNLKFHVIATALADYETNDSGTVIKAKPMFEGKKTQNNVMQYFSAVGYLYNETITHEDNQKEDVRRLLFSGSKRLMAKPCGNLTDTVNPNATEIIESIIEHIKSSVEE